MIIEGGTGNGYAVKVTSGNAMKVVAVTKPFSQHTSHAHGGAYSATFSATPTGAADCFFYLKNTDDQNMIIEDFGLYVEADEYFDVKIGDSGTPSGGSDVTPVNLNSGSGLAGDVTCQDGADITGLSGGSTAYRVYHANSKETTVFDFTQSIIMPKNGVLTIYAETGTTALAGYINFFFHNAC